VLISKHTDTATMMPIESSSIESSREVLSLMLCIRAHAGVVWAI
jgi:hypothetical protein